MLLQQRAAFVGRDRVVELDLPGLEPLDDLSRARRARPRSSSPRYRPEASDRPSMAAFNHPANVETRPVLEQAADGADSGAAHRLSRHQRRDMGRGAWPPARRDRSRLRAWRRRGPGHACSATSSKPLGGPGIIGLVQHQLRQRIAAMRVEAGRDDHEFGPESVERRQDDVASKALRNSSEPAHRPQRHVDDIADAASRSRRRCRDRAAI